MTGSSAIPIDLAKSQPEGCFGNRRRALRLNEQVMQVSRGFWPVKTAVHLAEITGYSTRAAENWLSGKSVIPTDALAALMQSEQGREFLSCVMSDYTPRWWIALKAWLKQLDYRSAQRQQEKILREILDEESARPGPHSAFVSDPEFHQGQPSPHHPLVAKHRRR